MPVISQKDTVHNSHRHPQVYIRGLFTCTCVYEGQVKRVTDDTSHGTQQGPGEDHGYHPGCTTIALIRGIYTNRIRHCMVHIHQSGVL